MKIIDCVQSSPEWLQVRCGIPTASNFDKILTGAGKPSKQREKYLYQLAGEAATGIPEQGFKSAAMQRGNDLEAEARTFYELIKGVEVKQVGFCLSDEEGVIAGCSPDGLVGDDGLLEIKCPTLATHVNYLVNCTDTLVKDYWLQIQGQLYITGRSWVDIMSYHPALKPMIYRVNRAKADINMLGVALRIFTADLKLVINKIKGE